MRKAIVGTVLVLLVGLATGSVLLLAYVAAALAIVMIAVLSVREAIGRWRGAERRRLEERWLDFDDREAA